jgi:hypothetical protein
MAMISARIRTLIALVACVAIAAIMSFGWVRLIYPSFCGGAYSDFKFYPHVLFLPASLVAFVVAPSDAGLRVALFFEAFLICFVAVLATYFFVAHVCRKDNAS